MTDDGIHWPLRAVVTGPCDEVQVMDSTWQDAPVWRPGDKWVATYAPCLTYPGPPHPGLLLRVGLAAGDHLELTVAREEPDDDLRCVFRSELTNGGDGLAVFPGFVDDLVLPRGTYPVSVWVDADQPNAVRRCVIVLGDQEPFRLGRSMLVWVDGWQMECCGEPFTVGSRVEWTLYEVSSRDWLDSVLGEEFAEEVTHGEEHHGGAADGAPTTVGLVRRIRAVVSKVGVGQLGAGATPIPATGRLVDVTDADGPYQDLIGYLVDLRPTEE
ncbi:hypothetical protein E1263_01500 [Kribbella antibiotica]|uniref:Uncharacterized protein n=1 Tax=Kribbella antibiotica TaxID=190195 RepID=A0A4R4ZV13_9ACTN|nr:DUF6578 domain-containing protein [Kribbella antibiotica]TDD63011.1 hypothetical protein E1263_01500 [Kribbella antibiotica]